jgi:hypothetical protein
MSIQRFADVIDQNIESKLGIPFVKLTALAMADDYHKKFAGDLSKEEYLEFVKRNAESYNKRLLEELGDRL